MDCAKATEQIQAYIDNALSAAARRELEQHLQACPECAQELAMAQALHAALRALPEPELPLDFSQRLHEALAAEPQPVKPGLWQRGWVKGLATAACLLALVGVVSVGGRLLDRDGWQADNQYTRGDVGSGGSPEPQAFLTSDAAPMAVMPEEAGFDDYGYDSYELQQELGYEGIISEIGYRDDYGQGSVADSPEMAGGGETGVYKDSAERAAQEEQMERKIIYNAHLSLLVDDVDTAYAQLQALASRYGGYLVSSNTWSYETGWNSGYVSIRVAAESLKDALAEISELGSVEDQSLYSEDVTMTYYDIQGRLEQYQLQEGRLLDILARAETVEDLIAVESELTRVRAQLESLTGQMRYYDQMTALSAIDISLSEPSPQTQALQTGFWGSLGQGIREGFIRGTNALVSGMTNLIIWFFRALPTLIVVLVVILILVLIFRKRKPKQK